MLQAVSVICIICVICVICIASVPDEPKAVRETEENCAEQYCSLRAHAHRCAASLL